MRSQHRDSIPTAHSTMECPKCHTKQVVEDKPGRRVCVRCGFEFRSFIQSR